MEIALRIPSDVSVIEEAVELVARHCFAGWDAPKRAHFRFRVALSEALANAIVYGNGQEPALMVEVRGLLTGEGSEARSTPSRVGMVIEF